MAAAPDSFDHYRRSESFVVSAITDNAGMDYFRRSEPTTILALHRLRLLSIGGVGE
jgi:hypothetical protein